MGGENGTAGRRRPTRDAGRAPKRLTMRACVAAVIVLTSALSLIVASSSSAAFTHPFTGTSFGPDGVGSVTNFQAVRSIAIDPATGDVYVYDTGTARIYKFTGAGDPDDFSAVGRNYIESQEEGISTSRSESEAQVAIAPPGAPGGTEGDIYVSSAPKLSIQIFAPNGESIGVLDTFRGSGSETCGVTVDPSGHLFTGSYSGTIVEWVPSANPVGPGDAEAESNGVANNLCNVAADALGQIYAIHYNGGIEKLATIVASSSIVVDPVASSASVDPSTNDLYADRGSSVAQYSSAGDLLGSSGQGQLSESIGVAVDGTSQRLYASSDRASGRIDIFGPVVPLPGPETLPPSGIGAASATLNGAVNPEGVMSESCFFEWGKTTAYGHLAPCVETPAEIGSGNSPVPVHAEVALEPGSTYHFRLAVTASGGNLAAGEDLTVSTLGPSILSSEVSGVTTTAANVLGLIYLNGETTIYHVEYGTTQSYGSSLPVPDATAVAPLANGTITEFGNKLGKVTFSQGRFVVGQEIEGEGIKPGTVVTAVEGSPLTQEGTTLTLSAGTTGETRNVSVTSSEAAISQRLTNLTPGTTYHLRLVAASAGVVRGPDLSFTTLGTEAPSSARVYELVSPAQKTGEVIAPQPSGELGGSCGGCLPGLHEAAPMLASADGDSLAFVGQPFSAGLSAAANQYVAQRSADGWTSQSITPLKVAPNTASGFREMSNDLSTGLIRQNAEGPRLSPEAPSGPEGKNFENLYLWQAGGAPLRPLVTAVPPNRSAGTGNPNTFRLAFAEANSGAAESPALSHIVFEADDALTAAVPTVAPASPEVPATECGGYLESDCDLYEWVEGRLNLVNVLPGNVTAAVPAVIGSGRALTSQDGVNQAPYADHAVSDDGSRIFWSDGAGQVYVRIDGRETVKINDPGRFLTATPDGSKVLLGDGCIYSVALGRCEVSLTHTAAGFLGTLGSSENLSRVYFVSTEALAPRSEPNRCEVGTLTVEEVEEGVVQSGLGCNLYAYHDGVVKFIAALSFKDDEVSGAIKRYGDWNGAVPNRTARVSPDGRFLAFMSKARLTGNENRVSNAAPVGSTRACNRACFEVYEYDLQTETLICASCNPAGQRPLGESNLSLTEMVRGSALPQPENLPREGGGRLFFESQDVLVPGDANGPVQDVYEWTPPGIGGCERTVGCVALVSTGHSSSDSMFLTATPNASNVFFVTRERLVPQDRDDFLDVYDARAGGGLGEAPTAECSAEACRGPIAASPTLPVAGSSNFNGPTNPEHPKRKKHHKSKRKHHKKHHKSKKTHKMEHHKSKRSSDKQGGSK
jgi:hypothetical protein